MGKVDSFKHKKDKRKLIPSKEEAGTELGNKEVTKKTESVYPKNPVVHRGQDPELFWLNKYGNDDLENVFKIDIRSLYRAEHISPEALIKNFYRIVENGDENQYGMFEAFGNGIVKDEIQKVSEYYKHDGNWSNRIILGDSLLVMNSLLEREGLAGKVQMIYVDPPYGIKYGSNWQIKLNNRNVKDGDDDSLSGEPEQIKAYRDTWELGIHSYLSYLRDRLLIAKELLTDSGSCFVQISDENVHLVRNIMDEVFGSENFVVQIIFKTTGGSSSNLLPITNDFILWYAKKSESIKYRELFRKIEEGEKEFDRFNYLELEDGNLITINEALNKNINIWDNKYRILDLNFPTSQGFSENRTNFFTFNGKKFFPGQNRHWSVSKDGMKKLIEKNRLYAGGNTLYFKEYLDENPYTKIKNIWLDTQKIGGKKYVVQTNEKVIQRCMLLCTDPGDLVLDPTCGSGTTAFVAEQWGRRWITTDTSRIAINIAKTRLMTASYPFYKLYDQKESDIKQGFVYKTFRKLSLSNFAYDEEPEVINLFDQPETDNKRLRVAGPFTVETLQNYDPISPEEIELEQDSDDNFTQTIFEMLKTAGIKNGLKNEHAVFTRVEHLNSPYLNAEGFYNTKKGERKAYFHIGPKFGTISKNSVNEAVKECRTKGDADWLVILGFSFESDIVNENITTSLGTFEVTKVRMHDDLLQEGLLKRDKKAASFVTIGEPDINIIKLKKEKKENQKIQIELKGLDIYDPIKDEVKSRDINNIAYWMLDDNYDGSNFIVRQVFFCGGDGDEYERMKKSLEKLQKTLKIEIDEEAYSRLYGHISHPVVITKKEQKIAIKIISLFGEESMKVISL